MKMPPLHQMLDVPATLVDAVLDADVDEPVAFDDAVAPITAALADLMPDAVHLEEVDVRDLSMRYQEVSVVVTFRREGDPTTSPSWCSFTVEGQEELTGFDVHPAEGDAGAVDDVEACLRPRVPQVLGQLLNTDPTLRRLAAQVDLRNARRELLTARRRVEREIGTAAIHLFEGLAALELTDGGPSTLGRLSGDWSGTPAELVAAAARLDAGATGRHDLEGTVSASHPPTAQDHP